MTSVLAFALPPEACAKLKALCGGLGITVIPVSPTQYGHTLSELLSGRAPLGGLACAELPEPMLVMDGFGDEQFDLFLKSLKFFGVTVPLKAVLTPYNASWTPAQLFKALCDERNAMRAK